LLSLNTCLTPSPFAVRRRVQPLRAVLRHGKEVGALPAGDARRGVQRQGVPLPVDEVRASVDYGGCAADRLHWHWLLCPNKIIIRGIVSETCSFIG